MRDIALPLPMAREFVSLRKKFLFSFTTYFLLHAPYLWHENTTCQKMNLRMPNSFLNSGILAIYGLRKTSEIV
jgi:hypothetical protein